MNLIKHNYPRLLPKIWNTVHDFGQDFIGPICSLDKLAPVAHSQCQSADFGKSELTDFSEYFVVYNEYRLRLLSKDIKHA